MAEQGQQQWTTHWFVKPSGKPIVQWLVMSNTGGIEEVRAICMLKEDADMVKDAIVADHNAHQDAAELRAAARAIVDTVETLQGGWASVETIYEDLEEPLARLRALLARTAATREEA